MDELQVAAVAAETEVRFIKLKEVMAICGKSRSSLYAAIQKGEFPAPVKVGGRASAWIRSEILQWTQDCIRASRNRLEEPMLSETLPDE